MIQESLREYKVQVQQRDIPLKRPISSVVDTQHKRERYPFFNFVSNFMHQR